MQIVYIGMGTILALMYVVMWLGVQDADYVKCCNSSMHAYVDTPLLPFGWLMGCI